MSYHFAELLLSQTSMAKCIFDFVAGGQLLVYKGGDPKGGGNFFEILAIFYKMYPS